MNRAFHLLVQNLFGSSNGGGEVFASLCAVHSLVLKHRAVQTVRVIAVGSVVRLDGVINRVLRRLQFDSFLRVLSLEHGPVVIRISHWPVDGHNGSLLSVSEFNPFWVCLALPLLAAFGTSLFGAVFRQHALEGVTLDGESDVVSVLLAELAAETGGGAEAAAHRLSLLR